MLLEVNNGLRAMTWFLNNFFLNAIEEETGVSMLDNARNGKVPAKFEVVDFEPSTDRYGAPLYSMQVFDYAKIRQLYPDEFTVITDRDSEYTERGIANTTIRENAERLFMNRHLKDPKSLAGILSETAEDKFRLGIIKIKVTEWLSDK